jgi:hypothetical protein
MNRLKKSVGALTVTVATVAMLGLGAAPAHAGTNWDYTNPATTGCATGSYAIASYPIKVNFTGATVGTLEVRWSPSCQTNWVRVNNTIGGSSYKYILRYAGPGYNSAVETEWDSGTGWSYSMQLYAPGCIEVYGDIYGPNGVTAFSGRKVLC